MNICNRTDDVVSGILNYSKEMIDDIINDKGKSYPDDFIFV